MKDKKPSSLGIESFSDDNMSIQVTQPEGLFCQVEVTARIPIPPSEVFEILTDPEQMKCFRSVQAVKQRSLVSDDGRGTQVIHVVQEGKWKFLWLSGSFPVHLRVEQDRRLGRIDFRLLTPGFMQVFEGGWRLEGFDEAIHRIRPEAPESPLAILQRGFGKLLHKPSTETLATFRQSLRMSHAPPGPVGTYVRKITARIVTDVVEDLQREARRRRDAATAAAAAGNIRSGSGFGAVVVDAAGSATMSTPLPRAPHGRGPGKGARTASISCSAMLRSRGLQLQLQRSPCTPPDAVQLSDSGSASGTRDVRCAYACGEEDIDGRCPSPGGGAGAEDPEGYRWPWIDLGWSSREAQAGLSLALGPWTWVGPWPGGRAAAAGASESEF